ncbi:MAG TPA: Gfo/Idh/MocA family oxidoreductase [Pyrinomonadaceae bacterium]|nr:Gfo/Idh/MocA family oxidoreductase [Pyrinomonadaceae bacterium]
MGLKWGLIGCGDISRKRVAPALRDLPNCDLVAVSRANFDQAESFAEEFGASKWYRNWRDLVADEEIEAVYIATPVRLHSEQTIAAAEAGKHVLCEKPMAMNVAECDRMIAACRANNIKLGIAYYRHFYPAVIRIRELIAAGEIGQPVLAQINAFEWFNPDPSNPRHWLIEKAQAGGGPMFDFGCHRIEVLLHILGPITQTVSILNRALFERQVEDTGVAVFQFERGALGVLSITHAAAQAQDTFVIFGSLGSIHVESLNEGSLRIRTSDGERVEKLPPANNLHQPLIDDFAQAVIEARNPEVDSTIGREVARIEAQIYGELASG